MATPCVEVWQTSNLRPLRIGEERKKKEETTQLQFTYLLHVSHVTHQNLIGYISAISKPIHFWFPPKLSAIQGLQSSIHEDVKPNKL